MTSQEFLPPPAIPEHYPNVTRNLLRLFNEGRLTNVESVLAEPEYGYIARIQYEDGSSRITYGNDLGLNVKTSSELAKDKGHTKFVLKHLGVTVPEGREFLLPWWADTIREAQSLKGHEVTNTVDEAPNYIDESIGYPVYVKPVDGAKGGDVYRVEDANELQEIFDLYNENQTRLAVVERAVAMPDYRVVVFDGELICAYQRIPLAVTGNGVDSLETLVNDLQKDYERQGRDIQLSIADPQVQRYLGQKGLSGLFVPMVGDTQPLVAISNLSAGGTSVDFTSSIAPEWVELAKKIASGMNLRLCGVDLACADITSNDAEYAVLEVNAHPGLEHYASSGDVQKRLVDDFYIQALNSPLPRP